jgi:tRNA U34 5-carboxymethylaminomethyl modifying enzyme MnmG/GidA
MKKVRLYLAGQNIGTSGYEKRSARYAAGIKLTA